MTMTSYEQGIKFLFSPDFSKLTGNSVLIAMGQAFFTLSLGMEPLWFMELIYRKMYRLPKLHF
jgi:SNF family Na+-dependent transporter